MKLMLSQLCGSTVITRYNNKTYKVDDIDFDMSPLSTFKQNNREVQFFNFKNIFNPLFFNNFKYF